MAFILSADIGTSSLKAVLFGEDLQPRAEARREYRTVFPGFRRAEQDPEAWWRAFRDAARDIIATSGISAGSIACIGIDGMSSLALPVSADGSPLRAGLIWLDRRAEAESDLIRSRHEARLVGVTGNRADPSSVAPKLMWLRDHEPEVYDAAACFLSCNGFLVQRLTGAFTMDVSQGGLTQLCEIRGGSYSEEMIAACGLDRRKLPEIRGCTDIVGTLTPAAAAETGLRAGTPVIAGAMDNVAATVGMKLWNDGDAYISAGTATNVGVLLDEPVLDGKGLIYRYGIGERWLVNGGVDCGGAGLRWFRDLLGDVEFEDLVALAATTHGAEHPLLFLPYMTGQRAPLWNENTAGVLLGLSPAVERRHLVRMFMESLALGVRHVLEELRGRCPERAMLTGGISHSDQWTQIFADATGMDLALCGHAEVPTLGMAILAGLGAGVFTDAPDAFARVASGPVRTPQASQREYYDDLYRAFRHAYSNVLTSLDELSTLRKKHEVLQ